MSLKHGFSAFLSPAFLGTSTRSAKPFLPPPHPLPTVLSSSSMTLCPGSSAPAQWPLLFSLCSRGPRGPQGCLCAPCGLPLHHRLIREGFHDHPTPSPTPHHSPPHGHTISQCSVHFHFICPCPFPQNPSSMSAGGRGIPFAQCGTPTQKLCLANSMCSVKSAE